MPWRHASQAITNAIDRAWSLAERSFTRKELSGFRAVLDGASVEPEQNAVERETPAMPAHERLALALASELAITPAEALDRICYDWVRARESARRVEECGRVAAPSRTRSKGARPIDRY